VEAEANKQVLLISSYNLTSPGIAMAAQAVRAAFRDSSVGRTQFYNESIDINRIPEAQYADDMVRYLNWKYKTEKIDLIVIFGGAAMQIVAAHRADFLPDTPVLYYYFDESNEVASRLAPNATGVYSKPSYGRTLETALALQPKTERAFIVSGSSALDKGLLAEAATQLRAYADRVEITYLTDLTIEEVQQKVSGLPPRSVIIFISLAVDRSGKTFNATESVSLVAASANAPTYGVARTHLGYGVVGGSLIDFEGAGTRIGELGVRILGGERPQEIAPQAVPNVTMFDWRELERWGLDNKELPASSVVIFREPSFWQRYRWIIVIGILVGGLEALLIVGLLINRARRRRAEAESRRLADLTEDQRRKLEDVISNVPGVVWEARFEPDGVTIRPQFVSHYIERLLGYSVEEWMSTPGFLRSIIHDDDLEEYLRQRDAILKGKAESNFHFRWRAKDGRLLWAEARTTPILDDAGAVVGMRGVTLDITPRKQAEAELLYHTTILASVHDAIVGCNTQFKVTSWNHAAEELYGWRAEEALGRPLSTLLGIDIGVDKPDGGRAEAIRRLSEEGWMETELAYHHRDGTPLYVQTYTIALRNEAGRITGYVSAHHDVTERRRAEESLRASHRKLELLTETQQAANDELLELQEELTTRKDELQDLNIMLEEKVREARQANNDWRNFIEATSLIGVFLDRQLRIRRYTSQAGRLFGIRPEDLNHPFSQFAPYFIDVDFLEEARLVVDDLQIRGREIQSRDGHWYIARLLPYCGEDSKIEGTILKLIDITERRRVEEQLRRYFELPLIGMAITSPNRRFVEVNQKLCDMLGYSMSEMKGKSWVDLTHPDDVAENVRLLEQTLRGETEGYTMDKRFIHSDGHIVYAAISARCVRRADGAVDYMVAIVQDITARKQAEEALRQSEQRIRDIVRAMPDLIFLMAADGTYLDCYTRESSDLLVPADQFLGKTIWEILPAELADTFSDCFQRAKASGEAQVHEYELPVAGQMQWYEARIVYTHSDQFLSIVRNITARKQAAEALRHNEERLQVAQRAARIGTWEWYIATGETLWSEGTYSLMGLEPGDGKVSLEVFRSFVHPADRERVMARAEAAVRDGVTYVDEFRIVRPDGEVLWLMAKGYVVRNASGQAEWMIGVNVDITERKQAEAKLIESEERFRTMADTAPVMIWVAGLDSLCTYVNQRWLDFTGRTLEQDMGNGWADNIHPDDYDHAIAIYSSAFDRREPFQMEYRLRRRDGEYRWVLDTGVPRFSVSNKFLGYIGSCIDVTDSRQAEAELQAAFKQVSELKTQLEAENIFLKEEIRLEHNHDEIIGNSEAIRNVLYKVEQVAPTDTTVLILGETGTGKELVAHALHRMSLRKGKPLVRVNCAALPATLIESELFGHERGAFTSATTRRLGRFELANGGTIFLDEIGDLPLELQVKLLRVLQEGEFERLGSGKTIKVDVRIIAATNRNLPAEIEKGGFREDLWYRLNVFPITVPPLRERRDDIPLLVEAFAKMFAKKHGKTISAIAPSAMRTLTDYPWPGNVRELANVIERAMVNTEGPTLRLADHLTRPGAAELPSGRQTLEELERQYILRVLKQTGWRIEGPKGAARILGLNPSTLRTRMAKLKIHKSDNGAG
jgi:PAS domain S-box-containing protein